MNNNNNFNGGPKGQFCPPPYPQPCPYPQPYPQYGARPAAKVKEKPEYSKKDIAVSVFTVIAAFCFVRYVLFHAMGFITTGLYISIISAAIIYLRKSGCRFSGFSRLLTAVLYIFSFVFSVTSNNFIKGLDALFLFGAGAYLVYTVGAGNSSVDRFLPFALCKAVFEYPFSAFDRQTVIASDHLSSSKAGSNAKYIILGLVITVPLTAIVAALLMSADDGVERMLNAIYDKIFRDEFWNIILQLIIALPCSCYLFGMFYRNTHRSGINELSEITCTQKLFNIRFISNLVMYTAVTPICILYVLFFISQGSYFLSAFTNNLPEGFTYADYARRGFFELCAVAVINLFVLCFISLFSKKAGREKTKALKFYSITLSVFTVVLIATAISKMVMYIDNYGLTELRLYTSWFMVLLALIFIMVIIKQFKFDMKFARHISAVFVIMFAILCFARPEAVIARYNISMYNSGYLDELDKNTLLRMTDDGLLTAYNMGAVTSEEVNEHKYSLYQRCTFGKYNISAVILDAETE